jgi:putative hemolysin
MPIELLLLVLLIALNAVFALGEMAIVTARKTRLKQLATRSRRARAALDLAQAPERFLSTVQVGITMVGVLSGLIGAAPLGELIAGPLRRIAWLTQQADEIGIVVSVMLITLATIVFGELVPKRIGLANAERVAIALALPFTLLSRLAYPLVALLAATCTMLVRPFGIRDNDTAARVSEEEIRLLIAESAEQGVIEPVERTMVERVLKLGDRPVETLMTPRRRICWLDLDAPLAANLEVMRQSPYARYPVRRGSDEEVVGVLEVKRLGLALANLISTDVTEPETVMRAQLFADLAPPLYVPEGTLALSLLARFRDNASSLALVVDEYGDLLGLVSPNDILGAILGQGSHALEREEQALVRRSDGSWLVAGSLPVEELLEVLPMELGPELADIHTVGGLVMAQLGHLPCVGESFEWADQRFEVVDLDGARIDRLIITALPGRSLPPGAA